MAARPRDDICSCRGSADRVKINAPAGRPGQKAFCGLFQHFTLNVRSFKFPEIVVADDRNTAAKAAKTTTSVRRNFVLIDLSPQIRYVIKFTSRAGPAGTASGIFFGFSTAGEIAAVQSGLHYGSSGRLQILRRGLLLTTWTARQNRQVAGFTADGSSRSLM